MDSTTATTNYTVEILRRLQAMDDRDAVVSGTRRITGREAADLVLRFATALKSAGLKDGDGVALFARNSPEALLLTLAVHFAGCRLVFVPPEPGNGELGALVRRADVAMFLFDPEFEDRAQEIADQVGIPLVFSIGASTKSVDFLTALPATTDRTLSDAADGSHLATLLYTGGSTGLPKLVTHRSSYYATLTKAAPMVADDVSANPTVLLGTLITHTSGHGSSLLGILTGHTLVLMRGAFDAGTALSLMESEQATAMMVYTPSLYELLDHPDYSTHRFPALRTLIYTGAAAAPARLRQAIERFGPVLFQMYGLTETGIITVLTPPEHNVARPESLSSCGRPGPGVDVELRDTTGTVVPQGQPGELYVRSPTVMEGYWNDPERTAEVLGGDGWFRTGDVAREDESGYLYLVDRVRDIIVTGPTAGNVYSRLLDDFLMSLPGIKEAATVGLVGDDKQETVHVVLVPQDPENLPDVRQLTHQITDALGGAYAPASYSITDALPRTTIGKTDKKALRSAVLAEGTMLHPAG